MTKLKCPFIGGEIEEFTVGCGLNREIQKVVCDNCGKNDEISCNNGDGKPECEGHTMMGIMENQIAHEGIKFMKELVKIWSDVKDGEIICPVCASPTMQLVIYRPGQKPLGHGNYWFCNGACQRYFPESECTLRS